MCKFTLRELIYAITSIAIDDAMSTWNSIDDTITSLAFDDATQFIARCDVDDAIAHVANVIDASCMCENHIDTCECNVHHTLRVLQLHMMNRIATTFMFH